MRDGEVSVDDLRLDVHEVLHRLRAERPVAWIPVLDRWLITRRDLVIDALRDAQTFTVDDPRFTTAQVVGPSMLSLDGSEHARHREPFATPFRRSASIRDHGDRIAATARQLVAALPDGEVDLMAGLAAPLAAQTITVALGLVEVDTAELLGWYREIVAAVDAVTTGAEVPTSAHDAFTALADAVERSRLTRGTPMHTIDSAARLSPSELHSNTAVMLFGAIETSEGMTANALHHVLADPAIVAQLNEDRTLIGNAVEESLRLEPAATLVDRYTTAEIEIAGVTMPARAPVSLSLAAANRDPAYFDDPDRFDLHRRNAGHHLAFVHGPHACIGMHLARLETVAAIDAVLDRWPHARLAADSPDPSGLVFRKPDRVVLASAADG